MLRAPLPDRPLTTAQAAALGWSRNALCRAVSDGLLRRSFTGVYVRTDVPDSTLARAQAAALVMSEHSVL